MRSSVSFSPIPSTCPRTQLSARPHFTLLPQMDLIPRLLYIPALNHGFWAVF